MIPIHGCMTGRVERWPFLLVLSMGALLLTGCVGDNETGSFGVDDGGEQTEPGRGHSTLVHNTTLTVSEANVDGGSAGVGPFLSGPNCLELSERAPAGLTNISIEAEFLEAGPATTVTEWSLKYFSFESDAFGEEIGPSPLSLEVEPDHVQAGSPEHMYIAITAYSSTVGVAHEADFAVSVTITGIDPSLAKFRTGPTCT